MIPTNPDLRAALYGELAAVLAEPPDWLALPGHSWPLWQAAAQAAAVNPLLQPAAVQLAGIAPESPEARRRRYRALFAGPGRPRFWLYESQQRSGRLLGPETAQLERLYAAAGVVVSGGELADHASLELAFLAHLAHLQANQPAAALRWRRLERRFIERHAGKWLPRLGRRLAVHGDPVYGPVGRLLADVLAPPRAAAPPRSRSRAAQQAALQPSLTPGADCTLCSFCVPACPTRALAMAESVRETRLVLQPAACTGCSRCVSACPQNALALGERKGGAAPLRTLVVSARLACPTCGAPTVSEAEYEFVSAQVGARPWMRLCLPCRAARMEQTA